jgi:hypothetical protein
MCHERERLIDYLYDVSDAEERRRVDDHLATCAECRTEVTGLRAVRQDLLAWDVPEHGSVWKPFAPARLTPWWREVPVWALAAAASVMFMLGLAGGVVARQLAPPVVLAQQAPPPTIQTAPMIQQPPAVSAAQLEGIEQRVLGVVQAQLNARPQPLSAHVQPVNVGVTREELQSLLAASEERQRRELQRGVLAVSTDSTKFLRQASFNAFKNNDLQQLIRWEVSQAMAQQQGGR